MSDSNVRPFRLSEDYIADYVSKPVPWGPLGYITYKRTYSRLLSETIPSMTGTEEWHQTCRRVIEGMFTLQKKHCKMLGLPWDDARAQRTAKDAYDRLFNLKWTPPGRGLWMMGTEFASERTGACLFNCAMVSTLDIDTRGSRPFEWAMDALCLGVGVGFDVRGAGKLTIKSPSNIWSSAMDHIHIVPDTREGWAESTGVLINAFFQGKPLPHFDYSLIRAKGMPIRGFGGVSSGAGPLIELHDSLRALLLSRVDCKITSVDIVDLFNLIGRAVVSGNVRRSAQIALGSKDDMPYLTMKNNAEQLAHHRWCSNNSLVAELGMDYSWHAQQSQVNGEPGYVWLDNGRHYGRIKDGYGDHDLDVIGTNPCGEIFLENMELCNIVDVHLQNHTDIEDLKRTIKVAYLYSKSVTLANTHWPETNQVMLKNRRIGTGITGVAQAINKFGYRKLLQMLDVLYGYTKSLDKLYSSWLCVPQSRKITTVKPSGSVSLLSGATSGIHFPEAEYYIRRIRFSQDSEYVDQLQTLGYKVELDQYSPNTVCVEFPIHEPYFYKAKNEVTIWQQAQLAADMQNRWADNAVSITATFQDYEAKDLARVLETYEDRLKCISFLRYKETGYVQAPYEAITQETYEASASQTQPFSNLSTNTAGIGEKYCANDVCAI